MDERNLSLHEDLLDLLQIALSGATVEGICTFQKRVAENLGYSGLSCILWNLKTGIPQIVFDGLKLKIEADLVTTFGDALIQSLKEDLLYINQGSREFLLLPILKNSALVGFYVLELTFNRRLTPPKTFLKSMNCIGLQIQSRFLSEDSERLDWFFKLGIQSHCLNPKQRQVLELLFKGESNKSIGAAVHLSEQAVKYHVGCLLDKFEVDTRYELKDKILELSRSLKSA